jgi:hypothetical protein
MKKSISRFALAGMLVIGVTSPAVAITMTVHPSLVPHQPGSPNWPGYITNALTSLESGVGGSIGNPATDPAAYRVISSISSDVLIVTGGFNSWLGQADPGTVFGPAFAGEFGNRAAFGLHILGDGTQFRLADLRYTMSSTDTPNSFNTVNNFSASTYAAHRVGIDYGPNRVKGGGDDIVYASGAATTLIDELLYTGVSNAFAAYSLAGLADARTYIRSLGDFNINMTYSLYDSTGTSLLRAASASTSVFAVPEPSGLMLFVAGYFLMLRSRRRTSR